MFTINAHNVNGALVSGLNHLKTYGEKEMSRAGGILVSPEPVTTVYTHPMERVLLNPYRMGNPVFHCMSGIFALAGENDATWLDQFIKDFSSRYAEEDGILHGSYGFRWRNHFEAEGGGKDPDQLATCIRLLQEDPTTRQAVLQMWDPIADLDAKVRDRPCNLCVCFRIRNNRLNIIVYNRSNDILWGLYGENYVQFSMLLEYMALSIGVYPGTYTHVSHNYHVYLSELEKLDERIFLEDKTNDPYMLDINVRIMVTHPEAFYYDCSQFVAIRAQGNYTNKWFEHTAIPMLLGHYDSIEDDQWRMACVKWDKGRKK